MDEKNLKISPLVIETHGLSKSYHRAYALNALNLQVHQNSIFGFLGPNGAGKTTTIKLLLGLASPTAGSASVFGMDIASHSTEIRRHVGYLAQDPRYYDYMTAREILRFTAQFFYTGPRTMIEERIEETLCLVGLEDKADRPIKGFSGGERQRLGIAQAQVNYPDLLILDEPAASLDPMGRHDVLEVMARLRKYTTIFYSTHILEDVQRVSDRVAILNHGELVAQAPIQELLAGDHQGLLYHLTIRCGSSEGKAVLEQLQAQPWVTEIRMTSRDQVYHYRVGVTDSEVAEASILPLVLSEGHLRICGFGREQVNLEDVFLKLVEGNHHEHA